MRPRQISGTWRSRPRRLAAATLAVAATASTAGFVAAPAASAPSNQCPDAFPVAAVAKDQWVSGLTVSGGTTPEGFSGTVLGVLNDGIMPGLDLIVVRLTSTTIDRAGIWAGMSGSPVYAADGRLLGAVAYGFSGSSPVAGVTPAADMYELLEQDAPAVAPADTVDVPAPMARRLVAAGDVTPASVDEGLTRLQLPLAIAGVTGKRLAAVADRLPTDGMRPVLAGRAAGGAGASDIVAGGNLAASLAYGDITAAAVGTVTAVCGDRVLGFGHPMEWTGPTTLALHGAEAVHVQADPVFGGFKMANIGEPVGTIDQDRMPGIAGAVGPLPASSALTSTVTSGSRQRAGSTDVFRPELVAPFAASHLLANLDRVFDGIGKGTGQLAWNVTGTREDGTPFTLQLADRYASDFDITFETAWDVASVLDRLEHNGAEDVTLDAVHADANVSRHFDRYTVRRVEVRRYRTWLPVTGDSILRLKAGSSPRFRVHLTSPVTGPRRVVLEVPVPRRALGMFGLLDIVGGNSAGAQEEFFEEEGPPFEGEGAEEEEPTFEDVLAEIEKAPSNDEVSADLVFLDGTGTVVKERHVRVPTGQVVDGGVTVPVRVTRR